MIGFLDLGTVDGVPPQIGILHDVLGLGAQREHTVGKPRQRAPMRLESRGTVVAGCHAADARLGGVTSCITGTVSPPISKRVQVRP